MNMDASKLRSGGVIDGLRIDQVVDTHITRWGKRAGRRVALGTVPVRKVTLSDDSVRTYVLVDVRPRELSPETPGGPRHVQAKKAGPVGEAIKVRASSQRWRGETGKLGDLHTWQTDQIRKMPGWDLGAAWHKS